MDSRPSPASAAFQSLDAGLADQSGLALGADPSFITVEQDLSGQMRARAGHLSGAWFSVKDNIDVAQRPTTIGTSTLRESRAVRDATVVSCLRDAGAMLVGKNNMYELALGNTSHNATFGDLANPFDSSRSAGGSSGGCATAVAAGAVSFALGTDTGGSIRTPAAFCGLVGYRPTTGRYAADGVAPLSSTRDTVGIVASSIEMVGKVDHILATHPSSGQRAQPPPSVRLGVPLSFLREPIEAPIRRQFERIVLSLDSQGTTIVPLDYAPTSLYEQCERVILFYEFAREFPDYLSARGEVTLHDMFADLTGPLAIPVVREVLGGQVPTQTEYSRALRTRNELNLLHADTFNRNSISALIYPTIPCSPTPLADTLTTTIGDTRVPLEHLNRNIGPSTIVGCPSIVLPVGSVGDFPGSITLESRPGEDVALLALAESVSLMLADFGSLV